MRYQASLVNIYKYKEYIPKFDRNVDANNRFLLQL